MLIKTSSSFNEVLHGLTLAVGIIFGFCFGLFWLNAVVRERHCVVTRPSTHTNHGNDRTPSMGSPGKTTVAAMLSQEIRLLCLIFTTEENHETRAKIVRSTWGRRCNVLLFMSTTDDPDLPAIGLGIKENDKDSWGKTKKAFTYIHEHYIGKADWFLKAEDDNYVIVENLRYMLQPHSSQEPVYFGRKFDKNVNKSYMSEKAGYVLSREALRRLVEFGLKDSEKCRGDASGPGDIELGVCLNNLGVKLGDSRDSSGMGRFFPFLPERHLIPKLMEESSWYWNFTNQTVEENDCCSDTAISFHGVYSEMMLAMDYFLYNHYPYGITFKD